MPNRNSRSFGETVRELRLSKGITLREFARMLGVSPTYVSQIEQDKFKPPVGVRVAHMAKILGQQKDELLALAGRVAEDLPEIIRSQPREMASFLRAARGLPAADLRRLAKQAEKYQSKHVGNTNDCRHLERTLLDPT